MWKRRPSTCVFHANHRRGRGPTSPFECGRGPPLCPVTIKNRGPFSKCCSLSRFVPPRRGFLTEFQSSTNYICSFVCVENFESYTFVNFPPFPDSLGVPWNLLAHAVSTYMHLRETSTVPHSSYRFPLGIKYRERADFGVAHRAEKKLRVHRRMKETSATLISAIKSCQPPRGFPFRKLFPIRPSLYTIKKELNLNVCRNFSTSFVRNRPLEHYHE